MSEHELMATFRNAYDVIDIEKVQGDIRMLNAGLVNCLLTLNTKLNEIETLAHNVKEKDMLLENATILNNKLQAEIDILRNKIIDILVVIEGRRIKANEVDMDYIEELLKEALKGGEE